MIHFTESIYDEGDASECKSLTRMGHLYNKEKTKMLFYIIYIELQKTKHYRHRSCHYQLIAKTNKKYTIDTCSDQQSKVRAKYNFEID